MASEMGNQPHTIQLIGGDGAFNYQFSGFMNGLMETVNFGGGSYQVVSIIGPQSSGKSTLLNHLFETKFDEMDALEGRSKTTNGIWLATCALDPSMLVLDVEGTDGKERGMDDLAFEKQSALFALAVSNIVIINMWVHDVGREQAANLPLLRTIFQVMMQLLKPSKTMLLFVLRDETKTPLEKLRQNLQADIGKIWDSVIKPQEHKDTQLDDFFSMEFMTLPSYADKEEEFEGQVKCLRETLPSLFAPGGLACNRPIDVPIKEFAHVAEEIWKNILAKKELNLPKHAEMVAISCCDKIVKEKLCLLYDDKDWCKLKRDARLGLVDEFGKKLIEILDPYLSQYDNEAAYFDKGVSAATRRQLESSALADAYPAYQDVLHLLSSSNLNKFKNDFDQALQRGEGFAVAAQKCLSKWLSEFDKGCADACVERASWDPSKVREKLRSQIHEHVLDRFPAQYERQLSEALDEPLGSILDAVGNDTWPKIRKLLGSETAAKLKCFYHDLSVLEHLTDLEIDNEITGKMTKSLAAFGRSVVGKRARVEAWKVVSHMVDKFLKSFSPACDSTLDGIETMAKDACSRSLEVLSVMAAIRLDDQPDNIKNTLLLALKVDVDNTFTSRSSTASIDILASSTWEGVAAANVLITPEECKLSWERFKGEIQPFVDRAYDAHQKAKKLKELEKELKDTQENLRVWKGLANTVASALGFVAGFRGATGS